MVSLFIPLGKTNYFSHHINYSQLWLYNGVCNNKQALAKKILLLTMKFSDASLNFWENFFTKTVSLKNPVF